MLSLLEPEGLSVGENALNTLNQAAQTEGVCRGYKTHKRTVSLAIIVTPIECDALEFRKYMCSQRSCRVGAVS